MNKANDMSNSAQRIDLGLLWLRVQEHAPVMTVAALIITIAVAASHYGFVAWLPQFTVQVREITIMSAVAGFLAARVIDQARK